MLNKLLKITTVSPEQTELNIVTCGLKAGTCPSAGQGFTEHIPVVTRNAPLLWVLMELLKDISMVITSKQTVTRI
jgi:hypothetical protein